NPLVSARVSNTTSSLMCASFLSRVWCRPRAARSPAGTRLLRVFVPGDQSPSRALGRLRPGTWSGARICLSPGNGFDQLVAVYQSWRLSWAGLVASGAAWAPVSFGVASVWYQVVQALATDCSAAGTAGAAGPLIAVTAAAADGFAAVLAAGVRGSRPVTPWVS